jgi:hypothetical protein
MHIHILVPDIGDFRRSDRHRAVKPATPHPGFSPADGRVRRRWKSHPARLPASSRSFALPWVTRSRFGCFDTRNGRHEKWADSVPIPAAAQDKSAATARYTISSACMAPVSAAHQRQLARPLRWR